MNDENDKRPYSFEMVCADIWRARLSLLAGIIIAALCAGVFLFSAQPHFRAQMIIGSADSANGINLSSSTQENNIFAVRFLAQYMGMGTSAQFTKFENIYNGTAVARILMRDDTIISGIKNDRAMRFSPGKNLKDAEDLSDYIARHVRLDTIAATGLRRMTYTHPDRNFATYFLTRVAQTADETIRKNAQTETDSRIAYLQNTSARTLNPEHRRILTELLMEQERTRMMVSGESSYAATIVEPASSLTKPVWPSVGIVLMCFMMVGAICGYVIHTLKETKYKISRMVFRSSAQSWGTLFDQTIKSNANDVTLSQDESRLQSIADRKRSSMK